jgi:hypothetical protein
MFVSVAIKQKDQPELKQLMKGIIKILKKHGGYEPEVDDIWVRQIAIANIYLKETEKFLDAPTATEHTFTRVTDMQLKWQKIIENAMAHLAISRRDRIGPQNASDLETQLREALAKAKQN